MRIELRRKIIQGGCIVFTLGLFGCTEQAEKDNNLISIETKKDSIHSIVLIDTTFEDKTKLFLGFEDSLLSFVWWQNDNFYQEGILDTLKFEIKDVSFNFYPLIWKNNSIFIQNSIYRKDSLILLGYHYSPYGICIYYFHENEKLVFGKKYLMNKWFSPLINVETGKIITIHEDFSRENNSADGLLYFYGRKISLSNFPNYSNENTIQFTNKDFIFECEDQLRNIDSCDWVNLIESFPKMKKFLNSK